MNILIVNRAMGMLIGGGEIFDSRAAYYLTQKGHHVTILTSRGPFKKNSNNFMGVPSNFVVSINLRSLAYRTECLHSKISAAFYYLDLYLFERQVMKWLQQEERYKNFDVIQVCGLFGLAKGVINSWKVPTVAWLPGPPSKRTQKKIFALVRNPLFKLFSRGAPIEFVRINMGLGKASIETIEPGLELDRIRIVESSSTDVRKRLGIPEGVPLGITVARLVPIKAVDFLLKSLAVALVDVPELRHVIVGEGPLLDSLKKMSYALGLEKQVYFLGHKSPEKVHELLSAANYFVLTSRYENFSNAILEAMAHGLPVIGTEVGYLQTLINHNEAGETISFENVDALASAIVRFCQDENLRNRYGENGQRFAETLNWPLIAGKLEKLYNSVIECGSKEMKS